MRRRLRFVTALALLALCALLVSATLLALHWAGEAAPALRGQAWAYALLGALIGGAAFAAVAWCHRRYLVAPADALARDLRTLLQARQIDRPLRLPSAHALGDLPDALAAATDALRGSRRELVRAMASATAQMEEKKDWLERILLELVREGVLVSNASHRLMLYNRTAARLFAGSGALGLGRSVFDLVAEAPVRHTLEQLGHRHQRGESGPLHARFVCASHDDTTMLAARMALITNDDGAVGGYVLTLEDISEQVAERQRNETLRLAVTRDLRGPVANLRAAAEMLHQFPDVERPQREAFEAVLLSESATISTRIEALASEYRGRSAGHWPMAEFDTRDLFACVAQHLTGDQGIELATDSEHHWMQGDSHALMLALELLARRVVALADPPRVALAAGLGRTRPYLELRWRGAAIAAETLRDWSGLPVPGTIGACTLGEIFDRHGSEPWSQSAAGEAVLRIPLQAATLATDHGVALPPRPEFYDFELMHAHSLTGALGQRRLKELSFVVFDTETTGLRPTQGDQIISIGAVRVTQGRVLRGETYDTLVHPGRDIPADSIRFHGITDSMVADAPPITEVLPRFHRFAGDAVLVAHNAAFDMKFLKLQENACGLRFENPVLDTLVLSVLIDGDQEAHSLDAIAERLGITVEDRHSALGDALATAEVLVHLLDRLETRGIETFEQVMRASGMTAQMRARGQSF